jgi:serine/threonine protein kinase
MTNGNGAKLLVGELVGLYRIVAHIAGSTYRAVHVDTGHRALIEIAPPDTWRDASLQMMRAQQVVTSLQHPGIARIVDRGMLADRRAWMATEVPNGIGVYDVIARREMPTRELTALIRDVADVLAYAHGQGVVHRALTLRSLVLATGPRAFPVTIADWGMRSGEIGVYAAPELSMHGTHDGRVDIYSLGVIAFRAATGVFPGEDGVFVMTGVSEGLASLIMRMLSINPEERPTAAEVRADAAELLGGQPGEDIIYQSGPRFPRPRWTPAPQVVVIDDEPLPLPILPKKPS